jgi:hypothetical protein
MPVLVSKVNQKYKTITNCARRNWNEHIGKLNSARILKRNYNV